MKNVSTTTDKSLEQIIELFKAGKISEVLTSSRLLLEQNPKSASLWSLYGLAAAKAGDFDVAEYAFQSLVSIDSNTPDGHNNLGNIFFQKEKYSEAIESFKKAIELQPDKSSFHNNLGSALLVTGKLSCAESSIKAAIELQPDNFEALNNMGNLYWKKALAKKAQYFFLEALKHNPKHVKANVNLLKSLEAHRPQTKIRHPLIIADREIRELSIECDLTQYITDDAVAKILIEADDIVKKRNVVVDYPSTQIFRRNNASLNCSRHEKIFKTHNVIPKFCFGCFKVQIEPKTVRDHFKLLMLFDSLKLDSNNIRKCMVELRNNVGGFYKGLIYCSSLVEAENIRKYIAPIVEKFISTDTCCTIKRGCSEFAESYPEYATLSTKSTDMMNYNEAWAAIEEQHDEIHEQDNQLTSAPSVGGFGLSDFLIFQHWIGYAEGIGDNSITSEKIVWTGSKKLFNAAKKRAEFHKFSTRTEAQVTSNYTKKPNLIIGGQKKGNILWLASYPKSGNTWLRTCIMLGLTGSLSLEKLIEFIPYFPILNYAHLRDQSYPDEKSEIRAAIQAWTNTQKTLSEGMGDKNIIVKTHQARGKFNDVIFPTTDVTRGVIQIVRDPRDVAISYSKHYGHSIDHSINKLIDEGNIINESKQQGSIEFISSWEKNFLSWADSPFPRLVIKYEDLIKSPLDQFTKIFDFLQTKPIVSFSEILNATSFESLSEIEAKNGFREATKNSKFFRVGKRGQWKKLSPEQISKIEDKFGSTMQLLGYI